MTRKRLISPQQAQYNRLYRMMQRATNLVAAVEAPLCNTRLGSAAWARHNEIMDEAYSCRDAERLKFLLDQAGAALDEVAQIV